VIKVVFCLPGNDFSSRFLRSWTWLMQSCIKDFGIEVSTQGATSSNIYIVRNICLGGILDGPANQKPFQGNLEYDYLMWIDSDIIFEPEDFKNLLEQMEKNKNLHILSGLYLHELDRKFVAVKEWNSAYYRKHHSPEFLSLKDIRNKTQPIKVDYAGMGFMMVRHGVFESLEYPWFNPLELNTGPGQKSFTSEDAAFCLEAKEANYITYVSPKVLVGHEKRIVLI
jgi:hypothetical protein